MTTPQASRSPIGRALFLLAMLVTVIAAVYLGIALSGGQNAALDRFVELARAQWWAGPLFVMLLAVSFAFPGVRIPLTVAALAVFGVHATFLYAWLGTMIGAAIAFALGRWLGMSYVERKGGGTVSRVCSFLRRRGLIAIFLLRVAPAPFIASGIINPAAGASGMAFWKFIVGTGIGIIPQMAVFTYGMSGFFKDLSGKSLPEQIMAVGLPLVAAIAAAVLIGVIARRIDARFGMASEK
jgi:uncharacterized membrane protein YdjX (TVP38/TMEM64 family)